MKNDLAKFYTLTKTVDTLESLLDSTKTQLTHFYDELVKICPHSEAVDHKSKIRGVGASRRCKICGITDYASEGGTPGDEYDYGYPGHPSRSFWKDSEVELVDDEEYDKFSRFHQWVVADGKPRKRFS